MSDKIKVMPCACFSHDEEGGRLRIDMEMTEVDKKDINLEMRKDTFCVSAPRGQETEYAGCFKLSHEIFLKRQRPNMTAARSPSSHPSRIGDVKST